MKRPSNLSGLVFELLPERGPSWWRIAELRFAASNSRVRRIALLWLLVVALSVVTGILNVAQGWNGLTVEILGFEVDITVYPPFVLSVLAALWLGPTWGAIPIYLANLASALTSGMPLPKSALFAAAGVIETLMLWGALVALRVDPDLPRKRDVAWFLSGGVVAAATASLAAILWSTSHGLPPVEAQRVWRGWIIGDLAQIVLLVLPILFLLGPRARAWIDRQLVSPPHQELNYTHGVGLVVAGFAILGLVVFLGVDHALGSIEIALDSRTTDGELLLPRLREIVLVMGMLSTAMIIATGMFSTALARLGERQRREAREDSLTGCLNRRAFEQEFAREAERSRRLGLGLAVLFVDLDEFKELNDQYGHAVGDVALERLGRRLRHTMRESDLVFRWGGEEFLVLTPHVALSDTAPIAERLRTAVAAAPLVELGEGLGITSTVSVGVAFVDRFPCDSVALIGRADQACYEAKRQGRNRVVVAAPG